MALDTDINLTTLDEVKAFLGESLQKDGIWIYWSSDDADAATVEVTDTTLVLKVTVGTAHRAVKTNVATIGTSAAHGLVIGSSVVISGMTDATYDGTHTITAASDTTHFSFALVHADEVETVDTGGTVIGTNTLTFADADKDIISELIIAINALTGWKSGRICHADAASTDLVITGALNTLGDENEITLKIINNYLLTELINCASDLINRNCNRILKTSNYTREIYYGSGYNKLLLDQYPITRVTRLSVGRANSFSILNTSTDANFCTVEITATTIRLIVDGGDNDDDEEITLADYSHGGASGDCIDDLIADIHTHGHGWSITTMATDTATRDASELLIRPSMFVNAVTSAYCETVDDDITDYRLLKPSEARNEGIIEKSGVFMAGYEYFIDYTAGYTTIPYVLEQFCIYLVCYVYGKSKRAGDEELKSETFGEGADYKYERISMADFEKARALMPLEIQNGLDLFKKREL